MFKGFTAVQLVPFQFSVPVTAGYPPKAKTAVFDAPASIVSKDGKNAVLYTWYDNEYGYTRQVIRLAKHIAKVRRLIYY